MIRKRLFGPSILSQVASTIYVAPAAAVARRIHVSNPPGNGARSFTVSIGADAPSTRIVANRPIQSGTYADILGPFALSAGETLQAYASGENVVMTIDGEQDPPVVALSGLMVTEGDSITQGVNGATPWPTYFANAHPLTQVWNVAQSGARILDPSGPITTQGPFIDEFLYDPARGNLYTFCAGSNDWANGATPEQIVAGAENWAAERRAAHSLLTIVAFSILPRGDLVATDSVRVATNELLAASPAFDDYVDVSAAMGTWDTHPELWQGDEVHPTSAGNLVIFETLEPVLAVYLP